MSDFSTTSLVAAFLIFCRIGSCMMLLPGIGSARVPVQVRLFLAIAVTLAIAPLHSDQMKTDIRTASDAELVLFIASESVIGMSIGFFVRIIFLALNFAAATLANYIGYAGLPGVMMEEAEEVPAGVAFVPITATLLFFETDQHIEVLRALLASYTAWPLKSGLSAETGLTKMTTTLSETFLVALQIASPFLIYSMAANLGFGILSRVAPQIPIYFISVPFIMAGGLLLLFHASGEMFQLFTSALSALISRG